MGTNGISHWTNQAETPIRLPKSTYKGAPSSPWIWRRATWTNSSLSIPKMAFVVFFIQCLMVAVDWTLVEFINWRMSISIKEQGDLFWTPTHQDIQSGIFVFEICCSQIVDSWLQSAATDGECEQNSPLQTNSCLGQSNLWTEHPHTSHFLALACTHFYVAHDIASRCFLRITSCFMRSVCLDPLRLSTLRLSHFSFSFSWSSSSSSLWVGSGRSS